MHNIGTTTVCGVVIDRENGKLLEAMTLPNDSPIESVYEWEKQQDVKRIYELCIHIVNMFRQNYKEIRTIGISSQMHGVLYVDKAGEAVSPLYSWQDERGEREYRDGLSYSEYLTTATGYRMATGFGLTTHFYNLVNGSVPAGADCICTIGDYIAMKLADRTRPVIHKSMAMSLGMYDIKAGTFDIAALEKVQIDSAILPEISKEECCVSEPSAEIQVSMALGDNQASFLGAVTEGSNTLVNIGTASQLSVFTEEYDEKVAVDYRPYIDGTFLMVGAPLCGGASYAMLKRFFEMTIQLFGCQQPQDLYAIMNQAGAEAYNDGSDLMVDTRFKGTRVNPKIRGAIENIGTDNFTPAALVSGVLQGMGNELLGIYNSLPAKFRQSSVIIGSGNGIRNNELMQRVIEDTFGARLEISLFDEEASCGAALYAMYAAGYFRNIGELQQILGTVGKE